MHLRYDCYGACVDSGEMRHPVDVVGELGITYLHAAPQGIVDQWVFWCCGNVPDELPSYIVPMDIELHACVGWGLSREDAERLVNTH